MFDIEDIKEKNKWFDFSNYNLTNIFKNEFKNDCLASEDGPFNIIWIDDKGYIIEESYRLSMIRLKNLKIIRNIENEILNIKCKSIDRNLYPHEIHMEFDKKIKVIKEKEKGLKRLLLKDDKLYLDQKRTEKINGLIKN